MNLKIIKSLTDFLLTILFKNMNDDNESNESSAVFVQETKIINRAHFWVLNVAHQFFFNLFHYRLIIYD